MLVKPEDISEPSKATAEKPDPVTPAAIDAEVARLKEYVKDHHDVEVKDEDGAVFKFTIRPVTKLAWDVDRKLMRLLADKKEDEFLEAAKELVAAPNPDTMRIVLMRGTVSPRFSHNPGPKSVDIDDFLSHDVLAINLYSEIANLSWKGIGKLEGSDGGPPPPVSS